MQLNIKLTDGKNIENLLSKFKTTPNHDAISQLNITYPDEHQITKSDIDLLEKLLLAIPLDFTFLMKLNEITFYDGSKPRNSSISHGSYNLKKYLYQKKINQELYQLEKIILCRHSIIFIQVYLENKKYSSQLKYLQEFLAEEYKHDMTSLQTVLKQHLVFLADPLFLANARTGRLVKFDPCAHRLFTYDTLAALDEYHEQTIFKIFLDINFDYLKELNIDKLTIVPYNFGNFIMSSFETSNKHITLLTNKLEQMITSNKKLSINSIALDTKWEYKSDEEQHMLFKLHDLFQKLGIKEFIISDRTISLACIKAITEYIRSNDYSTKISFKCLSFKEFPEYSLKLYIDYMAAQDEKLRQRNITELKTAKIELKPTPTEKHKSKSDSIPLAAIDKLKNVKSRRYKKAFLDGQDKAVHIELQYAHAIDEQQLIAVEHSEQQEVAVIVDQVVAQQLNKQELINYRQAPIDFPVLTRADLTKLDTYGERSISYYLKNYEGCSFPYTEIDNKIKGYDGFSFHHYPLHLFDNLFGGAAYRNNSPNHITSISIPALTELLCNREYISSGLNWFSMPQHFIFLKQNGHTILHFDKKYIHDKVTPLSGYNHYTDFEIKKLPADLLKPEYLTEQENKIRTKYFRVAEREGIKLNKQVDIFLCLYPVISALPLLDDAKIEQLAEYMCSDEVASEATGIWYGYDNPNYLKKLEKLDGFQKLNNKNSVNSEHSLKNIIKHKHPSFVDTFRKLINYYNFDNKNLSALAMTYYKYGIHGIKQAFSSLEKINNIVVNKTSYYLNFKQVFIDPTKDLTYLVEDKFKQNLQLLIEIAQDNNKFYWWQKLTIEQLKDNEHLYFKNELSNFDKQLEGFNYFLQQLDKLSIKVQLPAHGDFNAPLIERGEELKEFIRTEYAKYQDDYLLQAAASSLRILDSSLTTSDAYERALTNKRYSYSKHLKKFLNHTPTNMFATMQRVLFVLERVSRPDLTIKYLASGKINLLEACHAVGVENFDTLTPQMQLNLKHHTKGYQYNTTLKEIKTAANVDLLEAKFFRYICMHGDHKVYEYNKAIALAITKRKLSPKLQNKLMLLAAITMANISNLAEESLVNVFEQDRTLELGLDAIIEFCETNPIDIDYYSALRLVSALRSTENYDFFLNNIRALFEYDRNVAELFLANFNNDSSLLTNKFSSISALPPLGALYFLLNSSNVLASEFDKVKIYTNQQLEQLVSPKIKTGRSLLIKIVEPNSEKHIAKILANYTKSEKPIVEKLIERVGQNNLNYKLSDFFKLSAFFTKIKPKQTSLFNAILSLLKDASDLEFYSASQLRDILQLISTNSRISNYDKIKVCHTVLNFGLTKTVSEKLLEKLSWLISSDKHLALINIYMQAFNKFDDKKYNKFSIFLDDNHTGNPTLIELASKTSCLDKLANLLKYASFLPEIETNAKYFPTLEMLYNIVNIIQTAAEENIKNLYVILNSLLQKIPMTSMQEKSATLSCIFKNLVKLSPESTQMLAELYTADINPSLNKLAKVLKNLDYRALNPRSLAMKLTRRGEFTTFQHKVIAKDYQSNIIQAINQIHSSLDKKRLGNTIKQQILNDFIYIDEIANGVTLSETNKVSLASCSYQDLPFKDIISNYRKSDSIQQKHIYSLQYIAALYNMIVHIKDFEPRTEQLLVILHSLYLRDINPLFGIVSGEGKTLIIAMLAAVKWLTGNQQTIEILTTTKTLANESYHQYKTLYSTIGIPATLLFSDAPAGSYIKGGINVSTLHEFILYRLKYSILGTEEYDRNSIAMVDEFDKNYGYQPPCNISKIMHPVDYTPIFSAVYDYMHSNYFAYDASASDDITYCLNYMEKHAEFAHKQLMLLFENKPEQLRLFIDDMLESFLRTNFYVEKRDFIISEQISYSTLTSLKLMPLMDGYPAGEQVSFALMDQQTLSSRLNKTAFKLGQDKFLPILPQPTIVASMTVHDLLKSYANNHLWGFTGTTGTTEELVHAKQYYNMLDYQFPRHIKHKRFNHQPDFYRDNTQLLNTLALKLKREQNMKNAALIFCRDDNQVDEAFEYLSNNQIVNLDKKHLQRFTANVTSNEQQILGLAAKPKAITLVSGAWNRGIHIKVKSDTFLSVFGIYHQDKSRELLQMSYRTGRESPGKTEWLIAIDRFNVVNQFYLHDIGNLYNDINRQDYNLNILNQVASLKELVRLNKCYLYINRSDMHNSMQAKYLALLDNLEQFVITDIADEAGPSSKPKKAQKAKLAIAEVKSSWYNIVTNSQHRIWAESFTNHKDMLDKPIPEISSKRLLDKALARYSSKLEDTWNEFIQFVKSSILKDLMKLNKKEIRLVLGAAKMKTDIILDSKVTQSQINLSRLNAMSRPQLVYYKYQSVLNPIATSLDVALCDKCKVMFDELTLHIPNKQRQARISEFVEHNIIHKIFKMDYEITIVASEKRIGKLESTQKPRFILTNSPSPFWLMQPTWKLYFQKKSAEAKELKLDRIDGLKEILSELGRIKPDDINKHTLVEISKKLDIWLAIANFDHIKHSGQLELVQLLKLMLNHGDISQTQYEVYFDKLQTIVPEAAIDYSLLKLKR